MRLLKANQDKLAIAHKGGAKHGGHRMSEDNSKSETEKQLFDIYMWNCGVLQSCKPIVPNLQQRTNRLQDSHFRVEYLCKLQDQDLKQTQLLLEPLR